MGEGQTKHNMIAVVDYNAGNLTSVVRALASIGYECTITDRPEAIAAADRVVFPGVGAAGAAVRSLAATGLDEAIQTFVASGRPLLGICLGTQIIMEKSSENQTSCLGILAGEVFPFPEDMTNSEGRRLKIPHMGWNHVDCRRSHPLFDGIRPADQFYFVHSYYPAPAGEDSVIATTVYGLCFASVVGFENLAATQFHPEKSGRPGLRLLDNFCRWRPC